jgi:hypothetical protein
MPSGGEFRGAPGHSLHLRRAVALAPRRRCERRGWRAFTVATAAVIGDNPIMAADEEDHDPNAGHAMATLQNAVVHG